MKKFAEKFTWNKAYWTGIIASWIFMTGSWLIPDPYAFALLAPMITSCAFAVFAGWMGYKEKRAHEAAAEDHIQA